MATNFKVVQAKAAPRSRRAIRRPQWPYNVTFRPFEICPMHISPVLAGESLDSLLHQAYCFTDPVKIPHIGWWLEHYFFYVSHRALETGKNHYFDEGALTGIHLNATTTLAGLGASANTAATYMFKAGVDFTSHCLDAVVAAFFRDEGDEGTVTALVDYPAAYVDQRHWMHSLKLESATGDDDDLPGVDDVEDLNALAAYTTAKDQWEIMRDSGVQDVTYEDYLRAQGVGVRGRSEDAAHTETLEVLPELIRFSRQWTYPTNHIDPTDGSPTSALVWSIKERADKTRFFKEPGFLFGVAVARPKLYMSSQKGSAVGLMQQADYWLPKVFRGFPYTSVKEALDSATEGILQNQTEDYWLDIKDLYLYGDQYVNRTMVKTSQNVVALPTATMGKRFATAAEVKAFFVDETTNNFVKCDGIVHTNIKTPIGGDTTPGPGQP